MRKIRVLVVSGFSAFFKQGGGEAEAASLRRSLECYGFDADLYGPDVTELEAYDLVVFFSCHPSGMELLEICVDLSIKFVFWPNFWIDGQRLPSSEERDLVNRYCRLSDRVVIKSEAELALFQKHFDLDSNKILRINWFIDSDFLCSADTDRFKKIYGLDSYILSVGLIEPTKNQLALIEAAHLSGKQLVLIGGFRKKDYFERCRKASHGDVVFIPHLLFNSPILKAAYAGCESYAEVSFDPPGRSSLEAACFGKPLIVSHSDWAKEVFADKATLVNPQSVEDIRHALDAVDAFCDRDLAWESRFCNRHLPSYALKEFYRYADSLKEFW